MSSEPRRRGGAMRLVAPLVAALLIALVLLPESLLPERRAARADQPSRLALIRSAFARPRLRPLLTLFFTTTFAFAGMESTFGQPLDSRIKSLRPRIDLFFDKVLVNAEDPDIRRNRLALLFRLKQELSTVGDLSEIVTERQS